MHVKRKNIASCLATAAVAAVAFTVVAPQPALAGMGTGNPPPPPPPPLIVTKRMFETSSDGDFTLKGYPDLKIVHRPRDINTGRTIANTTGSGTSGGRFTYTVYEGQSPEHRGMMYGCSSGWTNDNININTDATLTLKVADSEDNADYTQIANPANNVITRWEWAYEIERNKETKVSGGVMLNYGTRETSKIFVPRNASAQPADTTKTKVTFQLTKLEGYDAVGKLRLKWIDDKENGRVDLVPQETKTFEIHKVKSVVQK